MNASRILLLAGLIATTACTHAVGTTQRLQPAPLSVVARAIHDADAITYQWPGAYFETTFHGARPFVVSVGEGDAILHVHVDGQRIATLANPARGDHRFHVAGDGIHRLRIDVASESQSQPNRLLGILVPADAQASAPPPRTRRMEFIGDSHTVGYGNTSTSRSCTPAQLHARTDNTVAYGSLLARRYDADYRVHAISGRGVVRNYAGGAGNTLPQAYPYLLLAPSPRDDAPDWQPQVVVVSLGTNDFSTPLAANERWPERAALHADYGQTYADFVRMLRGRFPSARIVLWATDLAEGEIQSEVRKVVAQLDDPAVSFVAIEGLSMQGCDWHPSTNDHQRIAEILAAHIDTLPASPWGTTAKPAPLFRDQPLVQGPPWIADPSAHVFDGRVYVYGSHDVDEPPLDAESGNEFVMRDYRVMSMDSIGGDVTVHPVGLALDDVPWASRQLWAPDATRHAGRYYLYFPAKDQHGVFRIGVAVGEQPQGPFKAQPEPMQGSYSIDPAVFADDDGAYYLYFGGIWGGQLQRWANGRYNPDAGDTDLQQPQAPALMPRVARLRADMLEFAEPPREVMILDASGSPLIGGDRERRFFEAAWVHKHAGRYYLSWSTGDTHTIRYATGDSPYGPFTDRGLVLHPVQGWTTHHSIVQVGERWYLFYHDTQGSGRTHLRNSKATELMHREDGSIVAIDPLAPHD